MKTIKMSVMVSIFTFLFLLTVVDFIQWYDSQLNAKKMTLSTAMSILNHPQQYSPYLIREAVIYMKKIAAKRKQYTS